MLKVSSNYFNVRAESGPEWFNDFLRNFYKISEDKKLTVDAVVKRYRDLVGMDKIGNDETDEIKKESSCLENKTAMRKLSKRHVVAIDKDVDEAINSFCKHSGGTKGTYAIISSLREKFGPERIKYSDDELFKYIESVKQKYGNFDKADDLDVGAVGIDDSSESDIAEYVQHGSAN